MFSICLASCIYAGTVSLPTEGAKNVEGVCLLVAGGCHIPRELIVPSPDILIILQIAHALMGQPSLEGISGYSLYCTNIHCTSVVLKYVLASINDGIGLKAGRCTARTAGLYFDRN